MLKTLIKPYLFVRFLNY